MYKINQRNITNGNCNALKRKIQVELKNNILIALPTGQAIIELTPDKENEFILRNFPVTALNLYWKMEKRLK